MLKVRIRKLPEQFLGTTLRLGHRQSTKCAHSIDDAPLRVEGKVQLRGGFVECKLRCRARGGDTSRDPRHRRRCPGPRILGGSVGARGELRRAARWQARGGGTRCGSRGSECRSECQ
eukprot:2731758-Pleurochrysis_carterae.AAC.1